MSRLPFVSGFAIALVWAAQAVAQVPAPSIRSATLEPLTGVLTITGEHLGPGVQVVVDGQPVTSLPGATDTRVEVQAPVTVLTTPGTYRLVVVDPVRKAWDGFVVVSAPSAPATNAGTPTPDVRGENVVPAAMANLAPAAGPGGRPAVPTAPVPLTVIEDSGSPYRTALGYQALNFNTTGTANTAVGHQALLVNSTAGLSTAVGYRALRLSNGSANTAVGADAMAVNGFGLSNTALGHAALTANSDGSFNTAIGKSALADNVSGGANTAVGESALSSNVVSNYNVAVGNGALAQTIAERNTAVGVYAGRFAATGTNNIYLGAFVEGLSTDTNTMRLGLPFSGSQGQNKTFIAGIRGTTVTNGLGVYVDPNGQLGSGPVVPGADTVGSAQVIADSLTAADLATGSVGTPELVDGAVVTVKVTDGAITTPKVADSSITTTKVADGAITAAKVGFAYAGLGANTFTGTQTIATGNLALPASTATSGNVVKNGLVFLHDSGVRSVYLGTEAGGTLATGNDNAALGTSALASVTAGAFNTAAGSEALKTMLNGVGNSATGYRALASNSTGSMNTAIGHFAGDANPSGSHNVYVGANVVGAANDANTMRLGLPFNATTQTGQNKTFIAGVAGTVLTGPAVQVFVDANGQLGTLVPAPFTGTINQPLNANPRPDAAALQQALDEQRALIATLTARLAALEAKVARPARR